jgi:hypothetical protein|tara:strand:- start:1379 stop:1852 length:474 start_codon:yes stop_codon:yes gene_type:complete
MAAMVFSSACVGGARGSLGSRRATCNTRFTHNRSIPRTARHPQGLKVFATVSKDNVFANNPGSLEALKNLTVDGVVRGPFTNQAPDDFSQMPHKERLKVFSGSAHPELSDVRALFRCFESIGVCFHLHVLTPDRSVIPGTRSRNAGTRGTPTIVLLV